MLIDDIQLPDKSLAEPLLHHNPASPTAPARRMFPPIVQDLSAHRGRAPNQLFAELALACGTRLLDEIDGPDSYAVFDATLEHATRLYDAACYNVLAEVNEDKACVCKAHRVYSSDDLQTVDVHDSEPELEVRHKGSGCTFERGITSMSNMPDLMDKEALKTALEHVGFRRLQAQTAFNELWKSFGRKTLDLHSFHTVLRLLMLHLLCGTLPNTVTGRRLLPPLPEETGFVGIVDWNPRVISESYFRRTRPLDVFLTHRDQRMKMRWVHCASVTKATILRLAVKYQLHPLPVEDTIQLQQQSMPLVRRYGNNFFIILPLLKLSYQSRTMLERHKTRNANASSFTHTISSTELPRNSSVASLFQATEQNATASLEPCVVEVEQGRLALFVSGPPNYDTVISVQTKWILRQSEDSKPSGSFHGQSTILTTERQRMTTPTSCCRRSRRRLLSRNLQGAMAGRILSAEEGLCGDGESQLGEDGSVRQERAERSTIHEDFDGMDYESDEEDDLGTEAFDGVAREIQKDFSVLRAGNASWLLWRLIDVCVDELTPILAAYRARLQWFASHIAQHRSKTAEDVEKKLLRTKVDLDWLQRKARPMVRVVKHLIHDKAIDPDVTRYLEDVEDHLETFIEEVSRSMQVCDSLRDQIRSFHDREEQGVLYVLALVTTMFQPMQLLTGIYGMNWYGHSGEPVIPGLGKMDVERGKIFFWGLGFAIVMCIYLCFRVVLKWI